jgi:hypothetical protein
VTPRSPRPSNPLSRRSVLIGGALAGSAAILTGAGCSTSDDEPDPLLAIANSASRDAAQAKAIFAAHPELSGAKVVAQARGTQAAALHKEVNREAGATESSTARAAGKSPVPGDSASAGKELIQRLHNAQREAAALVPTLPRYRAGLAGSVSAGCATLLEALR